MCAFFAVHLFSNCNWIYNNKQNHFHFSIRSTWWRYSEALPYTTTRWGWLFHSASHNFQVSSSKSLFKKIFEKYEFLLPPAEPYRNSLSIIPKIPMVCVSISASHAYRSVLYWNLNKSTAHIHIIHHHTFSLEFILFASGIHILLTDRILCLFMFLLFTVLWIT